MIHCFNKMISVPNSIKGRLVVLLISIRKPINTSKCFLRQKITIVTFSKSLLKKKNKNIFSVFFIST